MNETERAVFGWQECPARHPVTGKPCEYPAGHDDHHRAMGVQRMQLFGPTLTSAPTAVVPGGASQEETP